jgi:PAS domain S-box-containing protein
MKEKSKEELAKQVDKLLQEIDSLKLHIKSRPSEAQCQQIVANAGEGILGIDLDGNHTFVNPQAARNLGFEVEELIGKHSHSTWHHTHKNGKPFPDKECPIYQTLHSGEQVREESFFWRKDGSSFEAEYLSLPILENGTISGAVVSFMDITDRKKSELATKLSENKFRSVTESANDAIISIDIRGTVIGWNNGAESIFGYTISEIFGKTLSKIIPEKYMDLHIKGMKRMEEGGEKHVIGKTVELQGIRKNGADFPIELSLSEWETPEGKYFTGIIRDISSRTRNELESQVLYGIAHGITSTENLDELLALIHTSLSKVVYAQNCFIALHNPDTGFFSFPYFVDNIDPVPMPSKMDKSCTSYVFRTQKPLLLTHKILDQLLEKGEIELVGSESPSWIGIPLISPKESTGVLVLQHYDLKNVYTERDVKFLVSVSNQIALSIERKKSEEEIILKNELLKTNNLEKDKFFSIIAHDLRGPLSSFVAATQILTEEIQSMELEDVRELTVSMKESATSVYSLLENLLEWSRMKRGVIEFNPLKYNILERINDCTRVLTESVKRKNINIAVSISEGLEITADKNMFDTIVRNLVSNAIKFTPPGGNIDIRAYLNSDNCVEIRVSDSGIGMTPILLDRLFKLNEKTSRKGTEGEPSTGLGLLLCKEFIEKHNGKIWVESEEGKGSKFMFILAQ